ncbi:MAG TPA: MOSC domain-containing protein [Bryobacteraceae bacterium]|nr:MOSC domain-containing protein [Bryobacteraceae bacterium]
MTASVVSVNVGQPREVPLPGGVVTTGIFKSPVEGRVALRRHNLAGDRQADLTVHGGPYKAVYLYPLEHYRYWAEQLADAELPHGTFGENLTTSGLLEEAVRIGDRFRIGSAVLQVTQPRMPCYKLNVRFDRADMVKRFWKSGFSGIYFSVVEEGELGAGDAIEQVGSGPEDISVAEVVRLLRGDENDPEKFLRAMRSPLHGSWKEEIDARRRG